ncbi:hypothetical protein Sjap_022417 [Stephania japonica]|uniref:Cytochrome P450 n=1 Tax=Stephania japonica TaxID=461633 RepID=A0AAP0ERG3_9MAGN
MEQSILWVAVTAVFLLGWLMKLMDRNSAKQQQQLPPGPPKIPLIGNLYQLNKGGELLHVVLAKMAQEYGTIMTVWFGGLQPSIVVSDYDLVWKVLVTKASDFSARKLPDLTRIISANFQTLATCDVGQHWHSLRRGLHSSALNPQTISDQAPLQEKDIAHLISSFDQEASSNNGLVHPLPKLRKLVIRLLARFCFGPEFPNDEVFVEKMDCAVEDFIKQTGHTSLVHLFAITKYIPGLWRPYKEAESLKQRVKELLSPYLNTNKPSSPNCYLSFLLSQGLSDDVVILNLFELFSLAIDSTASAIAWSLAFMIHNEEVQEKVFEEVKHKLGGRVRENVVSVEKVSEMEYVRAVVKETVRMRPILPVAPQRAERDSELGGVKVREGTAVVMNLYAVLRDERVWREPNRFMPERFVGESDVEGMERCFVSFGVGRRICPGMELAKLQVALTLANLVKSFVWGSAVEGQLPDLNEDFRTFVLTMKTPLVARIVPRQC